MIPPSDELCRLWISDPGRPGGDPAALQRLQRTTQEFDRTIRLRDLREIAAAVLVSVIFLWQAAGDRSTLERAAHLWLAACGVWLVFYFRGYAKASRKPSPAQTLLAYQQQLVDRYDRQIRFLKTAKYWYILPFWIGLLGSGAAAWQRTGHPAGFVLLAGAATAICGGLWWLNEGMGVRYLQQKRSELSALTGIEGATR